MSLMEGFKNFGYSIAADVLLRYLTDASDEKIIRFLKLARRIPKNPENDIVTGIGAIIRMFEQKHPALEVTKNLINLTHLNVRRKILENWIINSFLLGTNKRDVYTNQYGFHPPSYEM